MYHDKNTDPRPRHKNKGNSRLGKIAPITTHSLVGMDRSPSLGANQSLGKAQHSDISSVLFLIAAIILIYLLFKPTPKVGFLFYYPSI